MKRHGAAASALGVAWQAATAWWQSDGMAAYQGVASRERRAPLRRKSSEGVDMKAAASFRQAAADNNE
jgi:hypothetical protein